MKKNTIYNNFLKTFKITKKIIESYQISYVPYRRNAFNIHSFTYLTTYFKSFITIIADHKTFILSETLGFFYLYFISFF